MSSLYSHSFTLDCEKHNIVIKDGGMIKSMYSMWIHEEAKNFFPFSVFEINWSCRCFYLGWIFRSYVSYSCVLNIYKVLVREEVYLNSTKNIINKSTVVHLFLIIKKGYRDIITHYLIIWLPCFHTSVILFVSTVTSTDKSKIKNLIMATQSFSVLCSVS